MVRGYPRKSEEANENWHIIEVVHKKSHVTVPVAC